MSQQPKPNTDVELHVLRMESFRFARIKHPEIKSSLLPFYRIIYICHHNNNMTNCHFRQDFCQYKKIPLEAKVERLLCERSKFLNGILHEFNWELANPRSETSWIKLPDKSRLLRLLRLQKTAWGKLHKLLPLKNEKSIYIVFLKTRGQSMS